VTTIHNLTAMKLLRVRNYNMQNVTLIKFASHKSLTYFKTCIFTLFHKFLNTLAVRGKYSMYISSPHYLRNRYYNLKKRKKQCECVTEQHTAKIEKFKLYFPIVCVWWACYQCFCLKNKWKFLKTDQLNLMQYQCMTCKGIIYSKS
jgi:hypothetical protein